MTRKWTKTFYLALLMAPTLVFAANQKTEQIQVTTCLAQVLNSYPILAENANYKILDIPSKDLTKLALIADENRCGRFVNLSHHFLNNELTAKTSEAKLLLARNPNPELKTEGGYSIRYNEEVEVAINLIESSNIMKNLNKITQFTTRSSSKKSGLNAVKWLKSTFENYAAGRKDVTTYFVNTGKYIQPSFVAVIGKDIDAPAIVIGAHIDTLDGMMPGADDDGSGSMTIMEAARVLLSSPLKFKHPIYFVWYAAEERGLVGSQYVVQDFKDRAIPVKAVAQFDMTGYRPNPMDKTMWIYRDYTDKNLNNFLADLINTYVHVPVGDSNCGYGCSDHASWTAVGIPAVFPCETDFENHNPRIHSSKDTMKYLTLAHMVNFTKLALAFAVELAEIEEGGTGN